MSIDSQLITMICPVCGKNNCNNEKYCTNCGARLSQLKIHKLKSAREKGTLLQITVIVIVIMFVMIGLIISYISIMSPSQTKTSQINYYYTPVVTPVNPLARDHGLNDPASDENLEITAIKSWDGDRTSGNNKEFNVQLKIQNLRPDKKIQIFTEDFLLIDNNGQQYPSDEYDYTHRIYIYYSDYGMMCDSYSSGCELAPNQSKIYRIKTTIPQSSQGSRLRFNFGGPSGKGSGGPFVYFDLNLQ